jgi:hypothetical protein
VSNPQLANTVKLHITRLPKSQREQNPRLNTRRRDARGIGINEGAATRRHEAEDTEDTMDVAGFEVPHEVYSKTKGNLDGTGMLKQRRIINMSTIRIRMLMSLYS